MVACMTFNGHKEKPWASWIESIRRLWYMDIMKNTCKYFSSREMFDELMVHVTPHEQNLSFLLGTISAVAWIHPRKTSILTSMIDMVFFNTIIFVRIFVMMFSIWLFSSICKQAKIEKCCFFLILGLLTTYFNFYCILLVKHPHSSYKVETMETQH